MIDNNPLPSSGFLWNFTFKLIVNVILTAIISGIIIDTFGEKRARKAFLDEDTRNKCFICNIQRENFERAGLNFEQHILYDHNLYSYIWFVLKNK